MHPLPPLKAYVVEDSPVIREGLIATLAELAAVQVVGCAEDEAGALRWLAQPRPELGLLIVDIFLRAGSGLGVLRAARALVPAARCVVLSNFATDDIRRKCAALGADRVFDKSNDIDALLLYCRQLAAAKAAAQAVSAASAAAWALPTADSA